MDGETENLVAGGRAKGKRLETARVPEDLVSRFVQVGRTYHFKDGAQAFTDHGAKLTTRSENTEVVRTLVAIAAVREWKRIRVGGTETFRREVWREAMGLGLEVRGYKATEFEETRARMRREFDARYGRGETGGGAAGGTSQRVAEGAGTASREELRAASAARAAAARDDLQDPRNPAVAPLFRGKLVEFGAANFGFNEEEQASFYVRIRTVDGQRTIWGKDLERALADSVTQPRIGDEVGVHPVGREKVDVRAVARNAEGEPIGEKVKAAHRNRWVVEKREFFAARAAAAAALRAGKVEPAEAVGRDPVLRDAYVALKVAELVAEKKMEMPKDRVRFVKEVRERLAALLEKGAAVPVVPMRAQERGEKESERARGEGRRRVAENAESRGVERTP